MLKNLTYKKKNTLLLFAFIVMLFFSWSFGFKKTFSAVSECNEMENKAQTAQDLPEKEEMLRKDMILLESKIGSNNDSIAFQQKLLKQITSYCDSLHAIVKEYPGMETKQETGYNIETHRFIVQGNFNSLVRLISCLEQKSKTGKLAGADFRKLKDLKTKREQLQLHLYIHHILKAV